MESDTCYISKPMASKADQIGFWEWCSWLSERTDGLPRRRERGLGVDTCPWGLNITWINSILSCDSVVACRFHEPEKSVLVHPAEYRRMSF